MSNYPIKTKTVAGVRKVEARLIAERLIGRTLPTKAIIHHANEDGTDNRPENLVVCPDEAYHNLLHTRMRAQAATGDPNKRRCLLCKEWDLPTNMQWKKNAYAGSYRHSKCISIDNKLQHQRRLERLRATQKPLADRPSANSLNSPQGSSQP